MKPMVHLVTIALLPLLGSSLAQAQNDPDSPPASDANRAAEKVPAAAPVDAHGQSSQPAAQRFTAKTVPPGSGGPVFQQRLQSIIARAPGSGGKPLVICSSSMEPNDEANLEEDLAVMAHLLNKALEEVPGKSRPFTAMGIDVFYALDSGAMRSLYLEGYGALFTLNVGFPLLAPPVQAEPKKEETETDSAWEEAKQELHGQRRTAGMPAGPSEEFSEEKVTRLKEALLKALKSAANIRDLKADDSVTVCVFGGASSGQANYTHKPTAKRQGATAEPGTERFVADRSGGQGGTMLTIQVRKADVDAFAKGTMEFEQFRQHARVLPRSVR